MADNNILGLLEHRDSSAINQAFDKWVARAGKRRAAICLQQIRRAHITPIIDQWMLVLVGLAVLRDCAQSEVWRNSFIAVNMHPVHRLSLKDWLQKIGHQLVAADKFEKETIDLHALLPKSWKNCELSKRQKWLKICDEDGPSWDVDLIAKLRSEGMSLSLVTNMFKIYNLCKKIELERSAPVSVPPTSTSETTSMPFTPPKNTMLYHSYNPDVPGWSPLQRFEHAVRVRNRTLGPDKGTTISPHLNVEVSESNRRFLRLSPEDVNMHKVLQQSTCKSGVRRKVAKRALTALGGVSGLARFVNDPEQLAAIRANLQFAESLEDVKHIERESKRMKAKKARDKQYAKALTKLGLTRGSPICKKHVAKLTIGEMKAIAFIDFDKTITGKADELRATLVKLLPEDEDTSTDEDLSELVEAEAVAQPMTQDQMANIEIILRLEDMQVDDCVEVYWKGDDVWYEGRIIFVDLENKQFEVEYFLDNQKLLHNSADYKVRQVC